MRVECSSCGKGIQIPPEKVPNRPFAFACPKCQNRIKVGADDPGDETRPVFSQETPSPAATAESIDLAPPITPTAAAPTPVAPSAQPTLQSLPLKPHEQQLLAAIMPVAFIVELGAPTGPDLDADLQAFGMQDLRRFSDLDEAVQQLLETEIGILVISVPKAKAPPFDLLEPLGKIPARMRRRVFVVLQAGNVTSLDGQVAFFLQVNCLINSGEPDRRRNHLQRALLYHLKLYQHWELDAT